MENIAENYLIMLNNLPQTRLKLLWNSENRNSENSIINRCFNW